jgi:hypothetical protein
MTTLDYYIGRTEQKLCFALIHIKELQNHPSRNSGDDFERSHHEAFLFQFYGSIDAFLQELNIYYSCGLRPDKVCRRTLNDVLRKMECTSTELIELEALESDSNGYLGLAKELRHHATHRGGIPMQHYLNGPSNLVHPGTREEFQIDTLELFSEWHERLVSLFGRFRTSAHEQTREHT